MAMNQEKIQALLYSTGALQDEHVVLPDGRHSNTRLRPLKVLQFPPFCRKVAFELVEHFLDIDAQVVVAASVDAILLAAEMARQLEARVVFATTPAGADTAALHPDFAIHSGDRVVMVDTLLTDNPAALRSLGRRILMEDARLIGVASLFDTSTAAHIFNVRQVTVAKITPQYWEKEACPTCAGDTTALVPQE